MKFFVNFLSCFRIAVAFAIIPTMILGMFWTTFILYVLAAASDFFDGWLAKKYKVTSKIGGVLDHIGDKLLVTSALIMLASMLGHLLYVVVPVIIMIAREIYISGLREFLGTQKIEMPVPKARFSMGKIKTTLQMVAIGAYLLTFAAMISVSPNTSKELFETLLFTVTYLPEVGKWTLWLAMAASLWSATEYTIEFAKKFKKIKK